MQHQGKIKFLKNKHENLMITKREPIMWVKWAKKQTLTMPELFIVDINAIGTKILRK